MEAGQAADTPLFRVRWVLRARKEWSLHSHQYAILYALLCEAARGGEPDGPPHLPDGLLLEAPEQCRVHYEPGDKFAFGATLFEPDLARASKLLHRISAGLVRLGRQAPKRPVGLGGNFDLVEVEDLVTGGSLKPGDPFTPLSLNTLAVELQRVMELAALGPFTLRFESPLRLERPNAEACDGHRYADGNAFDPGQFLRAVQRRMAAVGLRRQGEVNDPLFTDDVIALEENRLVWLDLEYGKREQRKSLGGALGRVRVHVRDSTAAVALGWGQYTRVGRNLHFGLGRYRIEELGVDPTACRRAVPLLACCLAPGPVSRAAHEHGLDPATLRQAAAALRQGSYTPGKPHQVVLQQPDGDNRELSIPPLQDRALQRLLVAGLGPAIERLFETSSFAWRRGLSRDSAAQRIAKLVRDGWRLAVRADFDRFFDRIPRALLRDRLEAWLGDDAAAAAILAFVTRGSAPGADPGVGISTGAPLSPLLGNMLLDRFDEVVEQEGGRLVRYADDFLILARTKEDADRLHRRSQELAAQLLLELNADSAVIDLAEPFEFLGFRFEREERWEYNGPAGPRRVEDLGWKDANRSPSPLTIQLPGEVLQPVVGSGVVVVGPGPVTLDVTASVLRIEGAVQGPAQEVPISGVEHLVLLGPVQWTADAPGKLLRAGLVTHLVSEGGWPLGTLLGHPVDDPESLTAQCLLAGTPARALALAIPLVRAKLCNFAALAGALGGPGVPLAAQLRELADRCARAGSLQSLCGLEGSGAAAWYRQFPEFLGRGFTFHGRVAPDATDPVNVLLNMGHTMLYQHAAVACRAVGLSPAVGLLHQGDGRYAALAADLQEPFRHLVERAVILASRQLKPTQFETREDGPYPLVLDHHAAQRFHALLQKSWAAGVTGRGQTEPRPWLSQMISTARGLRRALLDPETTWEPFQHP